MPTVGDEQWSLYANEAPGFVDKEATIYKHMSAINLMKVQSFRIGQWIEQQENKRIGGNIGSYQGWGFNREVIKY